jgi:hypothetical protein
VKIQDIGFFLVFIALILTKRPRLFLIAGLASWILAIPLFAGWIFFTAQRLTWYGAAFILTYVVISFLRPNTVK